MRHLVRLHIAATSILVAASLTGCGETMDALLGAPTPVYILDVEHLESPAVRTAGVYRPVLLVYADPVEPGAGRAAAFVLHLAAGNPDGLLVRLTDREPLEFTRTLARIEQDVPAQVPQSPELLTAAVREQLRAGNGAFWLLPGGSGIYHRIAVLIPESLLENIVKLEVSDAYAADGTPIFPASIELAPGFFYLGVVGDSVAWGNGLREPQKYSSLVAEEIQRRTGLKVIREVHAISGAKIVPAEGEIPCRVWCNGEVQIASTSILTQVDLFARPDVLDLVLVSGCINDVGVNVILNASTTAEEIVTQTRASCGQSMLDLLRKIVHAAPQARVVVTGYYPIISPESDLPALAQSILTGGAEAPEESPQMTETVARNSQAFLETAHAALHETVASVSAEHAAIEFIDPGFSPANAAFATQPLLWGLTRSRLEVPGLDPDVAYFPEDPLAELRVKNCFADVLVDPISCVYSSVGHPNPSGARVYADQILSSLEASGFIPASQPE